MRRSIRLLLFPILAGALCAGLFLGRSIGTAAEKSEAPAKPQGALKAVCIEDVPHIRQKPDFCGEACVAMWSPKSGYKVSQDWVFNASKLNPALGRGCHAADLYRALLAYGIAPGERAEAWKRIEAKKADALLAEQFKALHADLLKSIPSIVCMRYDAKPSTTEHFRLILGYDPKADEVIFHEPAVDKGGYRRMKRAEFLSLWPLKYRTDEWTVIRFRLQRNAKIDLATERTHETRRLIGKGGKEVEVKDRVFTNADYAQHIMALKAKYGKRIKNLTYRVEKPFVVVGNETPRRIQRRAETTVRWAVDLFKKDFFRYDPAEIITIWLMGDKDTYESACQILCGHAPGTPYGFYSPSDKVLLMNIATGGGTLVHEMFHPFIPANFPGCPSWLNEGMASLYEQCGKRGGKIVGHTNWRLAGLKNAIRKKASLPFKTLCGTTTAEFYGAGSGVHYAQARYLCYYLQEKGLLRTFYKAFYANQAKDPTGYDTLVSTLGSPDMARFQKDWEAYCLKLTFP